MSCPNVRVDKGIMPGLQVSLDRLNNRKTTYVPKDFVYCRVKEYSNGRITQSFADKYCCGEKYMDCRGCNGFIAPIFESD